MDELCEIDRRAVVRVPVGIHVLTEDGHLPVALLDELGTLVQDAGGGSTATAA